MNFSEPTKIEFNIGLKGSFLRSKKFGRMRSELGERRMNLLSPVSFVFGYEVPKTRVRGVQKSLSHQGRSPIYTKKQEPRVQIIL
jgi:hypothetical protein